MKIKKYGIQPDTHLPYHSQLALDVFCNAMDEFNPDGIINLGDCHDFYAVSSHRKDPSRMRLLKDEIDAARPHLERTRKLAKEYIYIGGNHEDRLDRYYQDFCPELWHPLIIEEVLRLDQLGIQYIPYGQHINIGAVSITHDLGKAGPTAHRGARVDFEGCAIIGHTHGMESTVSGNAKGVPSFGMTFGWLGDPERIDYKHKYKAKRDYIHGFGTMYVVEDTGECFAFQHPIVNGKVMVHGKLITA